MQDQFVNQTYQIQGPLLKKQSLIVMSNINIAFRRERHTEQLDNTTECLLYKYSIYLYKISSVSTKLYPWQGTIVDYYVLTELNFNISST